MAFANSHLGLDFGNWFSQIGIFLNIDSDNRRGGTYIDLTDRQSIDTYGIPSAFFYAQRYGNEPLIGQAAAGAKPKANCHRMLKRKITDGSVTIDGKTFRYEEMITAVIQHIVRLAEAQLESRQMEVTNKVCLAYPVSFTHDERQKLVNLAEKATLKDGKTHVKVVGTIAEPAAAALDYLASITFDKPTQVLVYDLGGGTFDISIVRAYPTVQELEDGTQYYYDPIYNDGNYKVCGNEFDNILKTILIKKAGDFKNDQRTIIDIDNRLEEIKRSLSDKDLVDPNILLPDGSYMDMISRQEFEAASAELLNESIKMVEEALKPEHSDTPPACIVLTGGASRMPMVQAALEKRFPQYKGKIHSHLPSKAISMGAARFGIPEKNAPMVQRTTHDIGICYTEKQTKKDYINTYIPAGTIIPTKSADISGEALNESQYINFRIHEAKKLSPDRNKPNEDYREICVLKYDNKGNVNPGHKYLSRIEIDEKNLLTLTVWEPEVPSHEPQKADCDVSSNITSSFSN